MVKIFFKTLGCKVNQYETQGMREILLKKGAVETFSVEEAGFIIVNSCTVTHNSDSKTYYYMRSLKRKNPSAKIILTGCVTHEKSVEELKAKGADLVLFNKNKSAVSDLVFSDLSLEQKSDEEATDFFISYFKGHMRAFVKIQDGCNMRCSYCKVCIVRGKSRSRAAESILAEIRSLLSNGYKEIVFAGIQLGAYGRDFAEQSNLVSLLKQVVKIKGVERIRLSSIEPFDVTDELIDFMAENKKICPHLHIPLQSADNGVLRLMRRGYSGEQFVDLISKLVNRVEGFLFTTDVIVGFPSESDNAFKNTVDVLEKTQPFKMHIFPFSPRKGTDAFNFDRQVDSVVIKKREEFLSKLNQQFFTRCAENFIGKELEVFVEGFVKGKDGFMRGKLVQYVTVYFLANIESINTFVTVRISSICNGYLIGNVV